MGKKEIYNHIIIEALKSVENRWGKIRKKIKERGLLLTILFTLRRLQKKLADKLVIWKNKIKPSAEQQNIDLPSHSVEQNRLMWNNYDWSQSGEEWTLDAQYRGLDPLRWKNDLINEMILKYIRKNSIILEIGPGAGRWTEFLYPLAKNLIVADISKKCLDICKKRFNSVDKIDYHIIDKKLEFIDNETIDHVWSYDVFVHINPSDIEKYLEDFSRILKPGGVAIIHHSGKFSNSNKNKYGWRAYMDKEQFANFVQKFGMKIIEQNEKLVHVDGDVISVFTKPSN